MFIRTARRAFAPRNLAATTVLALSVSGIAFAAVNSKDIVNNSISGVDLKNNSVSSLDITNNSLTGVDIKNGSLTGVEFKNNGLGGAKIDESSLEKVPSAGTADSATNATNATNAVNATKAADADKLNGLDQSAFVPAAAYKRISLRLAAGSPDVLLAEVGPIKVYARCYTNSGTDYLTMYAATSQDGALLYSDEDSLTGDGGPFLNAATVETSREFWSSSTTADAKYVDYNYDDTGLVWSPDGSKSINLLEGSGGNFFNYFGVDCGYDGVLQVVGA